MHRGGYSSPASYINSTTPTTSLSTTSFAEPASSVEVSTENTFYETVSVTVTACSESVSDCPASSYASPAANATSSSPSSLSSSSSLSSPAPSSTSAVSSTGGLPSIILSTTYPAATASSSISSETGVTVDAVTASVTSSNSSGSSGTPSPSSSSGASSYTSTPTILDSYSSDALIPHTISAVTALVPTPITLAAGTASPAPACTLLPESPITNEEQVGSSNLGTLCAPYLPKWLNEYPTAPWGNLTTKNSDATVQGDIPVTNVTRYYNFTITRGRISADGVLRDVILVNNQFPGPIVEANWGDTINVLVHNNISDPEEGTTLHWHGQLQKMTPWMDGTPATGQCPLAPGKTMTYNFLAELHGTSWYHAHYSSQYTAGVVGPMVVHGPTALPYDIDVGPVMLSDWYHIPYFAIVADAVGTNFSLIPPTSDSNLINGRGRFNCSGASYDRADDLLASNINSNITWSCVDDAPLASFRFQRGKVHRLRLMNTGANGVQKFSIDHHNMTIIATDYVPTVPYDVTEVTLGIGQRTDVLVTGVDDPLASMWMRARLPGGEPCGGSKNPEVLAAIYYTDADTTVEPTSSPWTTLSDSCENDALTLTVPDYVIEPSNDTWIQDIELTLELNATHQFEFRINGQAWHADYNVPLLAHAAEGNFTFVPEWNVYDFHYNNSIILNVTNNIPLTHPFHLHGHNFFILDSGVSNGTGEITGAGPNGGPAFLQGITWDGTVVNPSNPMRRDSYLIPPYGYAAIQFKLDNPGVWPFHCHVAWHLSGGQGMNILYKPDDIPTIPDGFVASTCVDWDNYSNHHVVDQIDAGS